MMEYIIPKMKTYSSEDIGKQIKEEKDKIKNANTRINELRKELKEKDIIIGIDPILDGDIILGVVIKYKSGLLIVSELAKNPYIHKGNK